MEGNELFCSKIRASTTPASQDHLRAWLFEKTETRLKLIRAPADPMKGSWSAPPQGKQYCSGLSLDDKGCRFEVNSLSCCEHQASACHTQNAPRQSKNGFIFQRYASGSISEPYSSYRSVSNTRNVPVTITQPLMPAPVLDGTPVYRSPPPGFHLRQNHQHLPQYPSIGNTHSRSPSNSDRSGSWTNSTQSSASPTNTIFPNPHDHGSISSVSSGSSIREAPLANFAYTTPGHLPLQHRTGPSALNGSPRRLQERPQKRPLSSTRLPPSLPNQARNEQSRPQNSKHKLSVDNKHQKNMFGKLRGIHYDEAGLPLHSGQFVNVPMGGANLDEVNLAFQTQEMALRVPRGSKDRTNLKLEPLDSRSSSNDRDGKNGNDGSAGVKVVTGGKGRAQRPE